MTTGLLALIAFLVIAAALLVLAAGGTAYMDAAAKEGTPSPGCFGAIGEMIRLAFRLFAMIGLAGILMMVAFYLGFHALLGR
jgi:hypothetical protein